MDNDFLFLLCVCVCVCVCVLQVTLAYEKYRAIFQEYEEPVYSYSTLSR